MKPAFRRDDDRTGLPVDAHLLLSLGPQKGVPLPGQDKHVSARPVAMGFFIDSYRELGHMRSHRALRQFKEYRFVAFSSLMPRDGFDADHVGNKVRLEDPITVEFSPAAKVTIFAPEAIGEDIGIVHDKILIVKEVKH